MPIAWFEKTTTTRVALWAFNRLKSGNVLFSGERQREGYPVVAEIPVDDDDIKRFAPDLDEAVTIIMFAPGAGIIDDPDADFEIGDITFHVEYVD